MLQDAGLKETKQPEQTPITNKPPQPVTEKPPQPVTEKPPQSITEKPPIPKTQGIPLTSTGSAPELVKDDPLTVMLAKAKSPKLPEPLPTPEIKPKPVIPPKRSPVDKPLKGIVPLKSPEQPKPVTHGPPPPPKINPDDIPAEVKADMKDALPAHRKLIDSYGVCEIYELPHHKKLYAIPVPKPHGPERAIINTVKEAATRLITIAPDEIADEDKRKAFFKKRILEIIEASPELGVPAAKMDFYADTIMREMIGYGSLDLLLMDDRLEDIMVNGPNTPAYVFHRNHEMIPTNLVFGEDKEITAIIDRIARDIGRRIDIKNPLLDARLPDGSRVNATIPPISLEGSTITVRKFREDPFTFIDLIRNGTMDPELAAFFWVAVEGMRAKPANILVAGGTGSGKTTTLNTLASFIPHSERIITIEDTAEIKLPMEHWIRFETRPPGIEGKGEINMDTLLKNTLRMRPDRVIVGEIRDREAFTLFTAMNTGHDGSLGTVHANNAQETVVRLKSPPMMVPETMLAALDFVIVQKRIHDRRKGTIRRIAEVAELSGILEGEPEFNYVFLWDPATDSYKSSYETSQYLQELTRYTGLSNTALRKEIQKRETWIKDLVKKGHTPLADVCREIQKRVG
ncbi:Flp pilus assembly complex ATPase component TadA [archaeon]|nr:Flp pilus assembly complex ATPase component TadA [archaeon]